MTMPHLSVIALAISATILSGCAKQAVQADNTPKNPTVVLNATQYLNGRYIPESQTSQVVYTREDRRRLDHDKKYSSFMMRMLNGNSTLTYRLDRNLAWLIDNKKKSYRECPIAGCADLSGWDKLDEGDEEEYQSYEDLGCAMTLTRNDFSVKKTGEERSFGGVPAQEYRVDWTIELQDDQHAKDMNLVSMIFWTTTPNAEMQNAWKVNRALQRKLVESEGQDPLSRLLGKDAYMSLAAVSGDIEKTDAESYGKFMRELNTIKGYPLSIKIEWLRRDDACQAARNKTTPGLDLTNGLEGAAKSLVTGFVDQQKQKILNEWQKKPLVTYIYEVTQVKEEMVNDSIFELPLGYRMVDRQ